ncbi:MAG: toll/interleukin-1 receptor domain-containing protein [Burkholderiales bacterium]|nr:toll/interleukin-1 receptor domain-containing protein [Burkholderiales bacterium]
MAMVDTGSAQDGSPLRPAVVPAHRNIALALRKALDKVDGATGMAQHRVVSCWGGAIGEAFSRDSILRVAESEAPLDALWQIAELIRGLRFPKPSGLSEQDRLVRDLLLAVALAVSDRFVATNCPVPQGAGAHVVPMNELLAASVVAAHWFDRPLTIQHDGAGRGPQPVSVIDDHPPLEFGTEAGSAQGVMRQELQALLARYFQQGEGQAQASAANLAAGLRQLRRIHGIAPMVAIRHGDQCHALAAAGERQAFTVSFDLPVFEYGSTERPADVQALEDDLMLHLQNSLQNLFLSHVEDAIVTTRTKVFVSYAHEDETWRDTLRMVLRPQERKGLLEVWDDKRIRTGDDWHKSIDEALTTCRIAVLLVSMPFLASDFIADEELSQIFGRHAADGLWIYPILIGPCDWVAEDLLASKQMKLCDGDAFSLAPVPIQQRHLAEVAKEIRERLAA